MASTAQLRTVRPVASLGQRAEEAAPASRIAPLPAVGAAARPAKLGASRSRSAVSAVAAAPAGRSQEYEKFESLLSKYEFRFRIGDKVTGTVFRVENNGLYVDIGAKSSAFCPAAELSLRHDAKARHQFPRPSSADSPSMHVAAWPRRSCSSLEPLAARPLGTASTDGGMHVCADVRHCPAGDDDGVRHHQGRRQHQGQHRPPQPPPHPGALS